MARSRIATIGLSVALAGIAVAPSPGLARLVSGDAFLCTDARSARAPRGEPALPTFHSRVGVTVIDRFTRPLPSERYTLDLRKPETFCRPVRLDGEEIADPLQGLEVYEARRTPRKPAPPPRPPTLEIVEGSFGLARLRIGAIDALDVPTMATGSVGGSGPVRDHFACYQVRPERGSGERAGVLKVEVRTAEGRRAIEVRKPKRLCVPASVRGEDAGAPKHPLDLLCYDARPARSDANAAGPDGELVATRNVFGNEVLRMGTLRLLCVPVVRGDVTLPSPTPFPTITPPVPTATPVPTPRPATLRIEPPAATALVRDRVCLAARMELPDGSIVDVTATALWRVLDGTIAVDAGALDGKQCFVGVGIGSTGISARDPETGIVSTASGGDTMLTAEWPIYKLTVSPDRFGLRVGESNTLTTTAWLTGDRTRNVTQHVRYVSDDPAVALAPNLAGNRSRIEGVAGGRATISVTDTLSSLSDTAEVVVGVTRSIVVEAAPALFPGEAASLRATGVFEEGFTRNLTQAVSYESSDPAVVVATNAPGDRSRVQAVSPGSAVITAVDPLGGLRSTCCGTVTVLGDLISLVVSPYRVVRRTGVDTDAVSLAALGVFAVPPSGVADRTISERVEWSTSDPSVVVPAALDPEGRQQFATVGGGEALVVARDVASGIASPPVTATIYDRLDRVDVGTSNSDPAEAKERTVLVGVLSRYWAWGFFDGARYLRLDDPRWVASDPSAVSFSNGYAYGLHPATVTISAVDRISNLSSHDGGRDAVLHVLGPIDSIALAPSAITLSIGQATSLTAIASHGGGTTEPVTQWVDYTSSDPSVVLALNESGNRSRILTVGPGTAVISARDAATGITSTASGGDTVVTVRDERLVRIVVSPTTLRVPPSSSRRFTAVGYFTSGTTQNLTQRVDWSSSAPAVAAAPNDPGDRSRIDALIPGVAMISASDPLSAISSTNSGDDATLTVAALTALTLTPATAALTVGDALSFTTLGAFADGGSINVTQDVAYTSSDPAVAVATNLAGNRSRVEAVSPGVATITAVRASSYPQATESNVATVTVAPAQ